MYTPSFNEPLFTEYAIPSEASPLSGIYPGAALNRLKQMIRDQNRRLVETEGYMSRKQAKQLDRIDMTSMIAKGSTGKTSQIPSYPALKSKDFQNWWLGLEDEELFCAMVPCFTHTLWRLNLDRYLEIDIKETDLYEKTMRFTVQDYGSYDGLWSPGIGGEIIATPSKKDGKNTYNLKLLSRTNQLDLFTKIPYDSMGWSKTDIELWNNTVMKQAWITDRMMQQKHKTAALELARVGISCISLMNYMLWGNKPVIERKPREKRSDSTEKPKTQTQTGPRVRTVGTIKIVSQKMPRPSTAETVRHYKVAVWKARGGVRHMKDGRLVHFKESIRTRKALKDKMDNEEIAAAVIKLKDNAAKLRTEQEETP